ncbi:DUF1194 domain-containing protein [Tropicimonas sp. IMCC34043]|uniref:DUF1194 domain-containing protein n=1 Tax=Tropicimonas sp. IMCC34043 TaxID=2248760 RepID=UPI0013007499|nr:DUF1194 domain-containing protein [Tropicimonas sp. IMCC34043]
MGPLRADTDTDQDSGVVGGVGYEASQSPMLVTVDGMTPDLDGPLDLVLCLCMDVSHSVKRGTNGEPDEFRLQLEGTATALETPSVRDAILANPGGVGVLCTQFSDRAAQSVGFAVLRSEADIARYADLIRTSPAVLPRGGTSIARGLSLSGAKIRQVHTVLGYEYSRAVIDISGDGRQSADYWYQALPTVIQQLAVQHGIVVNGMAIQSPDDDLDVLAYYQERVDTPAGFEYVSPGSQWGDPVTAGRSWSANSPEDFVRNMEMKLRYEVSEMAPPHRQRRVVPV